MDTKKLIEVALPLEKINAESAREKSIRHGHPSTIHLWWARRPLAAARAVIWASLVDDPSSHPEMFPSEEDQKRERQRLFRILEDLVVWENSNNPLVLEAANAEILKSTNNNPPALLDPFAGGGAIPLEAQRLGLEAHAHDLNPVAVLINKAMIVFPSMYQDLPPINPESNYQFAGHAGSGLYGLSQDVRYYGNRMKHLAKEQLKNLYPKVVANDGKEKNVIAWLWARTIICPNPACKCEMPLMKSFTISKKKNAEKYVSFIRKGRTFDAEVTDHKPTDTGSIGRKGAVCVFCKSSVPLSHIREEGIAGRIGKKLIAIVAEGTRGREYITPTQRDSDIADVTMPEEYPTGEIAYYPGCTNCKAYGMNYFHELFTPRQLIALTTFSRILKDIDKQISIDLNSRSELDYTFQSKFDGYKEAVITYLAMLIDKMADLGNALNRWEPNAQCPRQLFGRQAIPMIWDFAESNPLSNSSGSWDILLDNLVKCLEADSFAFSRKSKGYAEQVDAREIGIDHQVLISTDPPYYSNVPYADISDFFYVWMRYSLQKIYPNILQTIQTPKTTELVAQKYRFDGDEARAKDYFETGMSEAFRSIYLQADDAFPVTIYYAFKQTDSDSDSEDEDEAQNEAVSSSGWETMLNAIICSGFSIVGTWPMRTECTSRMRGQNSNALASSIVLVCRKRSEDAHICTRRNFIKELKQELRPALQKLQSSNIAPVDLAQSAIGPAMGVFSKYSKVLEADGSPMTVRNALKTINQELDLYFNEQDSDLDSESRFCVDLYSQYAFNEMPFGDANTLATAKNIPVATMASHGILFAQKGKVHLIERAGLPVSINTGEQCIWLLCQQLTYRMEKDGVEGCAKAVAEMFGSNAERAKDLAYRLYTIAERKKWSQEGYSYNALVVAWPEIQSKAAELKTVKPEQLTIMDYLQ